MDVNRINSYYIDGMDYPFESFGEIRQFLLSLSKPYMLYQFIDRHVYFGNIVSNRFYHCAVIEVSHSFQGSRMSYHVDILLARDNDVYSSFLTCVFFSRCFVGLS